MWVVSAVIVFVFAVAGCGGSQAPHPSPGRPVATAACGVESRLARAPLPGESGVYRAGPVTLAVDEDLAQRHFRPGTRPFGSEAIARVTGARPVTLRVLPSPGVRLVLEFVPRSGPGHPGAVFSDGRTVVRFPVCGDPDHRFGGGIVFAGQGCAQVAVQAGGEAPATMLIPIGDSLRACPGHRVKARLPYAWAPFLGAACGKPNSIACDRIGVGVAAMRPAVLVMVRVAGRLVTLSPPDPGSDLWQGYRQGAGPAHGALRVRAIPGRRLWFGSPERYVRTEGIAFLADGEVASTGNLTVLLHPGFG